MYIVLIHITSLFFAFYTGKHDVPAINSFAHNGSSPDQQALFHGSNWKLKLVFCLNAFLPIVFFPISFEMVLVCLIGFFVAGMNIWAWFDIIVVKYRYLNLPWYYLSDGNKVDRNLKKIFGQKAGVYKLFMCLLFSAGLTFLYFKYF